jgi:hypothetical protein
MRATPSRQKYHLLTRRLREGRAGIVAFRRRKQPVSRGPGPAVSSTAARVTTAGLLITTAAAVIRHKKVTDKTTRVPDVQDAREV